VQCLRTDVYAGAVSDAVPDDNIIPLRPGLFDRLPDVDGPCPYGVCEGDGWVIDTETRTATACRCKAQRLAALRTKSLTREIPERYRHIGPTSPEVEELAMRAPAQVRTVRRFTETVNARLDAGEGLGFHGNPGTGKTMLAFMISRAALASGRTVAVFSFPRLLAAIRDSYRDDSSDGYGAFLDRLVSVDLLQLDDLGAERPTEWAAEQIFLIIDGRWEARKSVVYTTNLPLPGGEDSGPESLAGRIGSRVVSRLAQMSPPVPLFGEDKRVELAPDLP
jgi:DNA replication protein DnaC